MQPRKDELQYVFRGPLTKRMTAEEFIDAVWQLTGTAPTALLADVQRGRIAEQDPPGHLAKAAWIWRKPNEPQPPAADPKPADPADNQPAADGANDGQNPPDANPPDGANKTDPAKNTDPKKPNNRAPAPPPAKVAKPAKFMVLRKTFELKDAPKSAVGVISQAQGAQLQVNDAPFEYGKQLFRLNSVTGVRMQPNLRKGTNEIRLAVDFPANAKDPAGVLFRAQIEMPDGSLIEISSDDSWQWSPDLPNEKNKFSSKDKADAEWLPVIAVKPPHDPKFHPPLQAMLNFMKQGSPPVRASLVKADLLQRALGRPNREQIVTSRPEELTMLEALDLTNGAILDRALEQGAKNLLNKPRPANAPLVEWLYTSTVARKPTPQESAVAAELTGKPATEQGLQDLLWSLCMLPEFQLIR